MKWLAAVLVVTLFAGCTSDEPVQQFTTVAGQVAMRDLQVGQFYAFQHSGGPLVLSAQNFTKMELYSPDDVRLGLLQVGTNLTGHQYATPALESGQYVLRFSLLPDGVQLTGQGEITQFSPLVNHVERHILARAPKSIDPTFGIAPTGVFVDNVTHISTRPVQDYEVYYDGGFSYLHIQILDQGALAMEAESSGAFLQPPVTGASLNRLSTETHPDGLFAGELTVRLTVEQLQGSIILELHSYSRMLPVPATVIADEDLLAYPFELGLQPMQFDVSGTRLQFFGPPAWVTLFDGTGVRVGVVQLGSDDKVTLEVAPGSYIAVADGVGVGIATDVLPADFSGRPAPVYLRDVAFDRTGNDGEYHAYHATESGIVYSIQLVNGPGNSDFTCHEPGVIVWRQGGETLGFSQDTPRNGETTGLLQDGPLDMTLFGFAGNTCYGDVTLRLGILDIGR